MNLQVAGFIDNSTKNGLGLRSVLFLSGCNHNCIGCHNKEIQDFKYGISIPVNEVYEMIMNNYPLIKKVTFSGGEPFESSEGLYELTLLLKQKDINIWIYSGYTFEEILLSDNKLKLLKLCDVLVDGKFDISLKNAQLKYKGSSNQRIIDIKQSLQSSKVIELNII